MIRKFPEGWSRNIGGIHLQLQRWGWRHRGKISRMLLTRMQSIIHISHQYLRILHLSASKILNGFSHRKLKISNFFNFILFASRFHQNRLDGTLLRRFTLKFSHHSSQSSTNLGLTQLHKRDINLLVWFFSKNLKPLQSLFSRLWHDSKWRKFHLSYKKSATPHRVLKSGWRIYGH